MPDLRFDDHMQHIRDLIGAAMKAADPARALGANWPLILNDGGPAYVVGAGKAALEMALQAERLYPGPIVDGAVAVVPQRLARLEEAPRSFKAYPASHPLPDQSNIEAANAIARVAERAGQGDRLLVLLSGGGSAHLTLPAGDLTLEDVRRITMALQHAGAPIRELNTVRKHCEVLKGGGLARLAAPAEVWTFILSDVIGDPLDAIASGPTAADPTTYAQALELLHSYRLTDVAPRVTRHIEAGARGERPETLKPGDEALKHVTNLLIGSNRRALILTRRWAQEVGWRVVGFEMGVEGEARLVGLSLGVMAHDLARRPDKPCCWLIGGETTVTVHGTGAGGRNQELALSAAIAMDGVQGVALAAFATDGVDGASDAAGAIVTGETCARARAMGLDPQAYLNNNDSHTFFRQVGGLIETGPTGTNVNDIALLLAY
ncbi:MAG: glycerate kinase [Anaerolineae bacterium]